MKFEEEKRVNAIAFIDAANIIYGAKKESGFKVDFEKYQKMLLSFGLTPRLKKTKFYLQEPKTKIFTCRFCGKKNILREKKKTRAKANCDVDLTIDALENLKNFKRFIFLTGDGDFEPLLNIVKKDKKEICVIASSRKTARSIRKIAAERFVEIGNLKKIIAKK